MNIGDIKIEWKYYVTLLVSHPFEPSSTPPRTIAKFVTLPYPLNTEANIIKFVDDQASECNENWKPGIKLTWFMELKG